MSMNCAIPLLSLCPSQGSPAFLKTNFQIASSARLTKTDGYFSVQHLPMQPCKTPIAIPSVASTKGAPVICRVS